MSLNDLIGAEAGIGVEHPLAALNLAMHTLLHKVGGARSGMVRSFVNESEQSRLDFFRSKEDTSIMLVTYRGIEYTAINPAEEVKQIQAALIALGAYWRPGLEDAFKDALRPSSPNYPLPHPIDFGAPIGMQKAGIYLLLVKRLVGELDVDMLLPHPKQAVDDLLHHANKDERAVAEAQAALSAKVLEIEVDNPTAPNQPHDQYHPWWSERD